MIDPYSGVPSMEKVTPGKHVLSISREPQAQIDLALRSARAALSDGHGCAFVGHRTPPLDFAERLRLCRADVDAALASRQLTVISADQAYTAGGYFDADRTLGILDRAASDAVSAGLNGFFVCGELTWLADGVPGADRVLEYEYRVSEVESLKSAGILCIYDGRTLPASVARELQKSHPFEETNGSVVSNGSFAFGDEAAADVPLAAELEPPIREFPCGRLAEVVSAHADGQLSETRSSDLEHHLASCPRCSAEAASIGDLRRALSRLATPAEASAELWQAVRARIADPH